MKNSTSTNSPHSDPAIQQDKGFSPWQRLKSKRISYLTLPLLVMATITEFVILSTGWKYQQMVCLPSGMGVTFFGIGPIGATILAVELLKLPLAIWTASRQGWQKGFMLLVGLPLICLLTFQLVKDMAVYEMGVALKPASEMLEKASSEETKIIQLNGELAAIGGKEQDRERKLTELAAKKAKAKANLEEALKRNEETRQDAISLTDYQKKELSEVEARQATIIKQFDADAAQLAKTITDLRARRETEVGRATKWNAEEARIENDYKVKMAEYANKKAAYEKDKADYDKANFLKRQLMKEPVDPGVPPVRESNTILKPVEIAEIDAQIKAKETELLAVNNKRRDRVAQVDADARRMREDFDNRSSTKREEADKKREELLAAQTALETQFAAEEKQIDQEYQAAAQKVDGIRAEMDSSRKRAVGFYEAREEAIKNTQVHRIATTVEIVRGLLFGKRPVSITATAKERGDLYTDQISMVRIWVYPVLAFIVAFLPTLMVEIGFSTVFEAEKQRPAHRLGFFGRRLHWLYTRAGRIKVLRAERIANEASAKIAARDRALAQANAAAEKAISEKEAQLQAAREAGGAASAEHEEQLRRKEDEHKTQLKKREVEWVAKFTDLADSLNRAVKEKDSLRDLQKSEVERQIQMRQNAWADRITRLRQELDDQRAAAEAERTALIQEHHNKLMEVTEDCKAQVVQARRQMGAAELAGVEKTARLSQDLKEALKARDAAESQLKHQADSLSLKLSQAQEDAARELEKAARQEKLRLERQQVEFEKTLRKNDEEFEHRLKQREQELTLVFDARLAEEKSEIEQGARLRETELERQMEARTREMDAHWNRDVQRREEAAEIRLKQREEQLQAQADARFRDAQSQAEEQLRRRELEFKRQLDAQSREAETHLREELQQKELDFHRKLKQREVEITSRASTRETELRNQWESDLRAREEEWNRQTESRVRAAETRLAHEAQQKEEDFQMRTRQREQQLQAEFDARQAELQSQWDQELAAKLASQAEAHEVARKEWEEEIEVTRNAVEPLKAQLARTERERDEDRRSASDGMRQVHDLKQKLMEASSLLNGWKNGKQPVNGRS